MGFETVLIERYKQMASLIDEAEKQHELGQIHLRDAAVIGCSALQDLSIENPANDFRRALNSLADTKRQNNREFVAITQTLGHFSSFLLVERRVMISGGFQERLADQIVKWCYDSYEEVRKGGVDHSALFENIKLLRDQACQLAEELKTNLRKEDESEHVRNCLWTILKMLAGIALVGLNSGALIQETATAALSGAEAGGSGEVGKALIAGAKWPAKVKKAGQS